MTEPGSFTHILVPTDGSDYSIAAGKLAIGIARTYHARLCFLYVIDQVVKTELTRFGGKSEAAVRRELEETGRRAINYLARLAADWGVESTVFLREGTPHEEILKTAKEHGVDLIVIGQVGLRGPRRYLIGSVAERVIEYAECPVLIAKRQGTG